MSDDYIRREDAKAVLQEKVFHNLTDEFYGAMQAIDELPAADVAPVVHARWEKKKESDLFYCSECELPSMYDWPYCERCGAKMDGGKS